MVRAFGEDIGEAQLGALLGDVFQIASIRHMRFENGPEDGSRLIQIRNASGLCVELLPDRCLDVGQVWLNGVPFSWVGPGGLPPGSAGLDMDEALGGLMATCGFDHIRQPEEVDGTPYPLHGSMALKPARVLAASAEVGAFVVKAEVRQTTLSGATFKMARRVTVPFDENRVLIEDKVSAVPATPIFGLYHINLGYPLITGKTRIAVEGSEANQLLDSEPRIRIAPAPKREYAVSIESARSGTELRLDIKVDGAKLPYLQTYRRAEAGFNLFCVEPTTHDRKPHAELVAEAGAPVDKWRSFSVRFDFHTHTPSTA
jgi:hypothetical protein